MKIAFSAKLGPYARETEAFKNPRGRNAQKHARTRASHKNTHARAHLLLEPLAVALERDFGFASARIGAGARVADEAAGVAADEQLGAGAPARLGRLQNRIFAFFVVFVQFLAGQVLDHVLTMAPEFHHLETRRTGPFGMLLLLLFFGMAEALGTRMNAARRSRKGARPFAFAAIQAGGRG